jgi:hypothetical protein
MVDDAERWCKEIPNFQGVMRIIRDEAGRRKRPAKPSHGGNTGSNPVGDAKQKQLLNYLNGATPTKLTA